MNEQLKRFSSIQPPDFLMDTFRRLEAKEHRTAAEQELYEISLSAIGCHLQFVAFAHVPFSESCKTDGLSVPQVEGEPVEQSIIDALSRFESRVKLEYRNENRRDEPVKPTINDNLNACLLVPQLKKHKDRRRARESPN